MTQTKRLSNRINYKRLRQLPTWLLFLIAGLFVGMIAMFVFYQILYRARVYPGVYIQDQPLGGKSRQQAEEILTAHFASLNTTPWAFHYGEHSWQVSPAALGIRVDLEKTVEAAYAVGRDGSIWWNLGRQLGAWWQDVHISPVVSYSEGQARQFLLGLASQIDQPVMDAALVIQGTAVYETQPQVGRQLDVQATLQTLREIAGDLKTAEIPLIVTEIQPRVTDASLARQQAQAMIAQPLVLYAPESGEGAPPEPGPWQLSSSDLASMLLVSESLDETTDHVQLSVAIDQQALRTFLAPLAVELSRTAQNGRFVFDDETRLLEPFVPSVDGRELDIETMLARINQQVVSTERRVPLAFNIVKADFHAEITGEELGITELIGSSTSFYAGSSAGRINNVRVAASKFHGLIIKPGETFSFSEHLGEVSKREGYDESLIISGNKTIQEVGGGICQVSTTIFRTALWAGYPIIERWAHAYRVGYYEQGGLPIGSDATIYAPFVDLKFQNDTPHHLLIEAYPYSEGTQLTFKLYSTKLDRTVEIVGPEVSDVIAHGEAVYKEDLSLATGEIKQVEWAANGSTVKLTRIIRDFQGAVLERKDFKSKYRPWNAMYLVGPGTEIPGVEIIREGEEEDLE